MPNPNELARVEEEKLEKVALYRRMLANPMLWSKESREMALRKLRPLERELGLDISFKKGYNKQS